MSTFADRLAAARLIALDRLVKIVEHSEDETQARLAAAAILKINPEPEATETTRPPAAPPLAPPNPRPPRAQPRGPSARQIDSLMSAMGRSIDVFDQLAPPTVDPIHAGSAPGP